MFTFAQLELDKCGDSSEDYFSDQKVANITSDYITASDPADIWAELENVGRNDTELFHSLHGLLSDSETK